MWFLGGWSPTTQSVQQKKNKKQAERSTEASEVVVGVFSALDFTPNVKNDGNAATTVKKYFQALMESRRMEFVAETDDEPFAS